MQMATLVDSGTICTGNDNLRGDEDGDVPLHGRK